MARTRTEDLLLSFLRTDPVGTGTAGLEGMSTPDWDDLLRKSARHGVTPLLYHRLKTIHTGAPVPAEVIQKLRKSYLQNAAGNMRLFHELGKVLESLRRDGIPVIALKGAHLAEEVYGNIALRPMGDVDLLVRREDLARVENILLGIGYVPSECNRQIAKDNCHFGYGLPEGGLCLEVHWAFLSSMDRIRIDMEGQWKRSKLAILAGVEVSVLSPEDLLLYLCLHASRHLFDMGLKHFCDISEAIRHFGKELDWEKGRFISEQAGTGNCVYLTLMLAGEFLKAPVPEDLLKTMRPDDFDERFMAMARERIFATGHRIPDGLSLYPNVVQLFGPRRFLSKTVLFLKRVFPPLEEMSRLYPPPSDSIRIYIYYPARIRDLLLRHGRQGWRLARGDEEMKLVADQEYDISPLRDWLMSTGGNPVKNM